MLDAAHGKAYRPAEGLTWPHLAALEVETRGIEVAGTRRGGRPRTTLHSDAAQGSRLTIAEARSRRE